MEDSPELWTRWWNAVREGRVELPRIAADGKRTVTSASFFGLSPRTDRVVFVVDRSGSMENGFGTGSRSRYDEAVAQLLRFLEQASSRTHFAVVLFSDKGDRWRVGLSRASEANLERAGSWLRNKRPNGGTQLFAGLRTALQLDRDGTLHPDRVEVDTVVVLCDGATAEGKGWVEAWLKRENEEAQLVFHCVQIGTVGNGTLEALAAGTGGDFVGVSR
jgi:Mg-chelatase subunit ChlD